MTQFNIILFGATSFVGQILTRYFVEHVVPTSPELRWAIAARSAEKLAELKREIGEAAADIPVLIVDAHNAEQLNAMCQATDVVVSTVGPYAFYGEPLVKACVENGTDYCDLTGETQWIRRMIDAYESQAQASGARIVHCCGFDSVPSDMGVKVLQQHAMAKFGTPVSSIEMGVKTLKGGASGGTIASLINVLEEAKANPALRKQLANPYLLCPSNHSFKARQHAVKGSEFSELHQSWWAPFVMAAINERIVHRSNACLDNAYGVDFTYTEGMLMGKGGKGKRRSLKTAFGLGVFMVAVSIAPLRKLLQKFVLPKPGEGPTPKEQLAGRFDMRFVGRHRNGQTVSVKVTGDRDPGYGSTAKMLGQAALCLAFDHRNEQSKTGRLGGFWTPASMFDERYIERLRNEAGVVVEVMAD